MTLRICPLVLVFAALVAAGCKDKNEREPTAPDDAPDRAAPADPTPTASDEGDEDEPEAPERDLGPVSTELSPVPADIAAGIALERVAEGFARPVGLEFAPGDDSGRLFVVEQHVARIRILDDGDIAPRPFFDMKGRVSKGNEQGLLGLAFHPEFADSGKLYVNYTDPKGTTRVVEYRVSDDDPYVVDMSTAREIFSLEQPFGNHNAGYLEFGPDGLLYVGTGDGGAAADPLKAGQDRSKLLAKMLRFDVDADDPKPEIVAIGLRNPWRHHFDAETGDLYIADVGQNKWEYVHVAPAGQLEGMNFGWSIVEGSHCFQASDCDKSGLEMPVVEYDHQTGCSITGGYVYRGDALPAIQGHYFYSDFCTALLRSFAWTEEGVHQHWDWKNALDPDSRLAQISAFGVDSQDELYILSLGGAIYKLTPSS